MATTERSFFEPVRAGVFLILLYVLGRMLADPFLWRKISEYYSYGFEGAFVSLAYFIYRDRILLLKRPSWTDAIWGVFAFLGGFLVIIGARDLSFPMPFDLSNAETLFLLLVAGPILEELIFRMALWEAFAAVFLKGWIILVLTTCLFSLGHLSAYPFVPHEYRGFVFYQSAYVLILGLATGFRRMRSGTISSGFWVHFFFNLGFFAGARSAMMG